MIEWMPIESAPRDGEPLWLYCPNDDPRQVVGRYVNDPRGSYWAYAEQLVMDVVGEAHPTHWMPLPEPPK